MHFSQCLFCNFSTVLNNKFLRLVLFCNDSSFCNDLFIMKVTYNEHAITHDFSRNLLVSHPSPVQPGEQMQTPSLHRPWPLQPWWIHSVSTTSHSRPFHPSTQWQRPPPYTPWPLHSNGHTSENINETENKEVNFSSN